MRLQTEKKGKNEKRNKTNKQAELIFHFCHARLAISYASKTIQII
jgi:hypothetical protein